MRISPVQATQENTGSALFSCRSVCPRPTIASLRQTRLSILPQYENTFERFLTSYAPMWVFSRLRRGRFSGVLVAWSLAAHITCKSQDSERAENELETKHRQLFFRISRSLWHVCNCQRTITNSTNNCHSLRRVFLRSPGSESACREVRRSRCSVRNIWYRTV